MSEDGKLKVGVVGLGFIGPAHIEGIRRQGVEVRGIAEYSSELARDKAEQLNIPLAYPTYEDMLKDPEIDVVHICSPNYLHFPQAKQALLAGKHVICEKPLTITSAEAKELVELAKEKKLVNAINFNLRFYPVNFEARHLVKNDNIGKVFIVQGSYLQDWLLFPTDWNWRLDTDQGGSLRAVADIGSHWIDLVMFITGLKVTEIFADLKTFYPIRKKPVSRVETFSNKEQSTAIEYEDKAVQTEDYGSILLRFENGAKGIFSVSQVSAGRKNRLFYEIDGSKSAVSWDSEHPNDLWIGHRDRRNEILIKDPTLMSGEGKAIASYPGGHAEGFPDTFKQLQKKVYAYILKKDFSAEPDFPTFKDGYLSLIIEEAVLKSSQTETWVKIVE
ncbi:MAG: Gfo/Idh/MocA family oxidoreductase [Chloroflexota bacterium]